MALVKDLKVIRDINYEDFTINNVIKLKTHAITIKRKLDKYDINEYLSDDISFIKDVENYNRLADMAYGYLNNKMNKRTQEITDGIHAIEEIIENLPEEKILSYIHHYNTSQTFNHSLFLGYGWSQDINRYLKVIDKFIAAVEEYEKIKYGDKSKLYDAVFCKELEENETLIKNNERYTFIVIKDEETAHYTTYRIDSWHIFSSSGTFIPHQAKDSKYKPAIQKTFPEWYL